MRCHEENTPNNYNKGGYNKNYNRDKNGYYGKKDWNKNNKSSYQKKDDKKESKDKDVYLTLTKDIKFSSPAGFNENIFACACRMIQEKVNSARQSSITDIETVNAVEKDNFMCIFNFPEDRVSFSMGPGYRRRGPCIIR